MKYAIVLIIDINAKNGYYTYMVDDTDIWMYENGNMPGCKIIQTIDIDVNIHQDWISSQGIKTVEDNIAKLATETKAKTNVMLDMKSKYTLLEYKDERAK